MSLAAAAVFLTRATGLVFTAGTMFVLARLLPPEDLGSYYLLAVVPPSVLALASLGLPGALTYHAGRGSGLDELRTLAIGLALGISAAIVVLILLLEPFLATSVLAAAPPALIPLIAAAIPGTMLTSFCSAVVLGRYDLRAYNGLVLGHGLALFGGEVAVVGLADGGLVGAIAVYVAVASATGIAAAVLMLRLAPYRLRVGRGLASALTQYGLRLQPASLAGFFSYRADVFLLSALLRDPAALGVYGLAVNIAELVFYVPDAIATVLFPRVAATSKDDAARVIPTVSRITLSVTAACAALVAIATVVMLPLVLSDYTPSVVPVLVLLPGIVGLSASKVLSGYLSGIGRPGLISLVALVSLVVNLILNVALIPVAGPSGAALASLVSYAINGSIMLVFGSREAGVPVRAMILLRRSDVERLGRPGLPFTRG